RRPLLSAVSDQIGDLLCNHDRRGVRVAARNGWHDRSIDNAQTCYSMDAQLLIDDGHRIVTHLTGADGMKERGGSIPYKFDEILVALDVRPWDVFPVIKGSIGLCLSELSREFHPVDERLQIGLCAQVIVVDHRILCRIW